MPPQARTTQLVRDRGGEVAAGVGGGEGVGGGGLE
jgi:hypothetical protein